MVGVSAFVGAGVVALGAASNLPDAKAVNPKVLANLRNASAASSQLNERNVANDRASRGDTRSAVTTAAATEAPTDDVCVLPLDEYTFTSAYGIRFGKLHAGIDLAAPDGTPYKSMHSGVVTSAGYKGGYGYAITIRNPDGVEFVYAHSRRLLVKAGDTVKAGQVIAEVGMSGYSYGTHLHIEVHLVDNTTTDPIAYFRDHCGVDIKLQVESYAGLAAAS
jgi:murein DD-endopeptidase MepM/ murein hydrolase activator NlpD